MRIKLISWGGYFAIESDIDPLFNKPLLCKKGLKAKVELPKGIKEITVVFTKRKRPESFTLTGRYWFPIKEFKGKLLVSAKWRCINAFNDGYKYVHIEYMEK